VACGQWSGDSVRVACIWRDKTFTCRWLKELIV
jgi:hypothetical protein